jgi:hypothetical protein
LALPVSNPMAGQVFRGHDNHAAIPIHTMYALHNRFFDHIVATIVSPAGRSPHSGLFVQRQRGCMSMADNRSFRERLPHSYPNDTAHRSYAENI